MQCMSFVCGNITLTDVNNITVYHLSYFSIRAIYLTLITDNEAVYHCIISISLAQQINSSVLTLSHSLPTHTPVPVVNLFSNHHYRS